MGGKDGRRETRRGEGKQEEKWENYQPTCTTCNRVSY